MITFWQQEQGKLVKKTQDELDSSLNTWVDARNVSSDDMNFLEQEYKIWPEHIADILDHDELARIEKENDYTLIIMRLPAFIPYVNVNFFTVPLGVILYSNFIITICWTDCEVLREISANKLRNLSLNDPPAFITRILNYGDIMFLRYLKEINRSSNNIQNELKVSVKNNELIQLLNLEKSLVYFTTSLKSNQLLIEKLLKTRILTFDDDDREWLEDVSIDNRQAIEMADTYSDILSGMMDAFASVISNNLNIVMHKLVVISILLMVPTLVTSFFGMNIPLPFSDPEAHFKGEGWKWAGIAVITAVSIVLCLFAVVIFIMIEPNSRQQYKEKFSQWKNKYKRKLSSKSIQIKPD